MDMVAIYCRLSDEDKNKVLGDSESIQNQKMMLTKYAVDNNWCIYKIYSDDDYSGLYAERPEFNQMIEDAEAGKFNIVLCKSQSRFARNMELIERYLHGKFIEWKIRFVSTTDNVDTNNEGGKKARQINGLVNEWYCEDLSKAIRATFDIKRQKGQFIGSFASYGYDKDTRDKNKLIIDEEAASVVRMIFDLYIQGNGTQHIAYILNEKGIPNPTSYKQSKGLNFKNSSQTDSYGLWNKTTVKRILKSEMYIGNMVQAKRKKVSYKSCKVASTSKEEWVKIENTHEPIVNIDTFMEVQRRINCRQRSTGEGVTHVLATKVRCLMCGNTMNKVTASKGTQYLRCKIYATDPYKNLCTSHSIRLDYLINEISYQLKQYLNSLGLDINLYNIIESEIELDDIGSNIISDINKTNLSINEKKELIKNLYVDKVKSIITEEQFNDMNTIFISEKEKLELRKIDLENELKDNESKINNINFVEDIIEKYKNFDEITHEIVNKFIDYVEVDEKNKIDKTQRIIVHWNF